MVIFLENNLALYTDFSVR